MNPPFFYGPFAPGWSNPEASRSALSTNEMLYDLLRPNGPLPRRPSYIDVRDVARSLVNALRAPPTSEVGRKRIIVIGESMPWLDVVLHLRKVMPELGDRLPAVAEGAAKEPPLQVMSCSMKRAEELLGMKPGEMVDWRKTAEDTVRCILETEKEWNAE